MRYNCENLCCLLTTSAGHLWKWASDYTRCTIRRRRRCASQPLSLTLRHLFWVRLSIGCNEIKSETRYSHISTLWTQYSPYFRGVRLKFRNSIADFSSGTVTHIHCEGCTSFSFQFTEPHQLKFAVKFLRHPHGNILHCAMIIFHGYFLSDSSLCVLLRRLHSSGWWPKL
jgi:hypothetical protein